MAEDYSRPSNSDGPRPPMQGRYEVKITHRPPSTDPLPCNSGNYTITANVTQTVRACSEAQYLGLYQIAIEQIDAVVSKVRCEVECRRLLVEMFRSWKCRNTGTEANPIWKATVVVAKRIFCANEVPTPDRWLQPANNTTFTNAPGAEPAGGTEPTSEDGTVEEIGKPVTMDCGETRSFYLTYTHREPVCPNVTDYKKYADAAKERFDVLTTAIKCQNPCVPRKEVEWHSWKCEGGNVVVELYGKVTCVRPGALPRGGCLGLLLGLGR